MPKKKFRRKLNVKLIKSKASYYVNELAEVLGVHSNTIGNMIREGLSIIENSYPYLIYGQEAIDFINKKQSKKKFGKLEFDEFIFFSCQKKVFSVKKSAILIINSHKVANLQAKCGDCKIGKLNKRISLKDLPEIQKVLEIEKLLNPLLIKGFVNSGICETKNQENHEKI